MRRPLFGLTGRNGVDPTRRFTSRVENYVRHRPGYPGEILELLRKRSGMTPEAVIADVGSGTGILSRLFLENGNRVFGIEPNAEMRLAGERLLEGYEGFTSIDATAEDTSLADRSVDFVVAGQAFHWFDPEPARAEFARILRPDGRVGLVWNARRKERTGFLAAYENLLEAHGTDYAEVNHGRRGSAEEVRRFFSPEPVAEFVFDNTQVFDLEGLKGRVLSSSYVPAEGEPGCAEMLDDLENIFDRHASDGRVTLRYDTRVYFGGLSND